RIAIEFLQRQGERIMSGQTPRPFRWIPLVATLLVSGVPDNTARADHCLAAPNSLAPQGRHWYYRLNWATQHKCWYLRVPGTMQQAATKGPARSLHSMSVPSERMPATDGARASSNTGDNAPISADVETLAVKPDAVPAIGPTTDQFAWRNAQEEI